VNIQQINKHPPNWTIGYPQGLDINNLSSAFLICELLACAIMPPATIKKDLQMRVIVSIRYYSLLTIFGIMQ
jgi:hypothetical protein